MSVTLSVALVYGVEITNRAAMRRVLDVCESHATVEAWPVGDNESLVVYPSASYTSLASGAHEVHEAVFDVEAPTGSPQSVMAQWRMEIYGALAAAGVTAGVVIAAGSPMWLVVCNAR